MSWNKNWKHGNKSELVAYIHVLTHWPLGDVDPNLCHRIISLGHNELHMGMFADHHVSFLCHSHNSTGNAQEHSYCSAFENYSLKTKGVSLKGQ